MSFLLGMMAISQLARLSHVELAMCKEGKGDSPSTPQLV